MREYLRAVHTVVRKHCGTSWEGTLLAVGGKQSAVPRLEMSHDEWEDVLKECTGEMGGWEYVDSEGVGLGTYGEKRGWARVREALESTEWEGSGDVDVLGLGSEDEDGEIESHVEGDVLRVAILRDGEGQIMDREKVVVDDADERKGAEEDEDEFRVEELESLMLKLQTARGMYSARVYHMDCTDGW